MVRLPVRPYYAFDRAQKPNLVTMFRWFSKLESKHGDKQQVCEAVTSTMAQSPLLNGQVAD